MCGLRFPEKEEMGIPGKQEMVSEKLPFVEGLKLKFALF